jgi:putative YpdA family bacillithiol system oxidoreductase
MESSIVTFVLSTAIILFFLRRYLKSMSRASGAPAKLSSPEAMTPCPRCGNHVKTTATFCDRCGVPLELFKIKTAQQVSSGEAAVSDTGRVHPFIEAPLCVGCGSCVSACPEQGALAVISGKAILADADKCLGHGDCVQACPTGAITLVRGANSRLVEVPNINHHFETNVAGLFIIGELGGVPLIKNAINEGKLVIDTIHQQLSQCSGNGNGNGHGHDHINGNTSLYDVIIIGAGPAGLSAALSAHKHGLKYLALERGEIASTIRNYPRHKFLMEEPVEMPLYGSLWVADSTKEALLDVWENIIHNTGVNIRTNEKVESIRRESAGFVVSTMDAHYRGKKVVVAIGKHGTPRRLGVPGEELPKVTHRLMEAEQYAGKNMLVVGGGDSAVEAALALSRQSGNRVVLSYRKPQFNRLKQRNLEKIEAAMKDGSVKAMFNSEVVEILPNAVLLRIDGKTTSVANDFVVVSIGGEPPKEFLQKIGVEIIAKRI